MQPKDSTTAESVIPAAKQFLSSEQMDELWDARGMKYRVDELHQMMLDRGLNVCIDRPKFRALVRELVQSFLVDGMARVDPRRQPRQRFPKVY